MPPPEPRPLKALLPTIVVPVAVSVAPPEPEMPPPSPFEPGPPAVLPLTVLFVSERVPPNLIPPPL